MELSGAAVGLLILAGFCAGLIDSIAGGGGLISVPALLAAGVPPHFALGTNKIQSCLGTAFSTGRYLRHGHVHLRLALVAAAMALAGSNLGALTALALPPERLSAILPPLILAVAAVTFLKREFGAADTFRAAQPRHYLLAAVTGLAIGFYDGFFGPGTGTFLAFAFVFLFGFDLRRANGNAKVVNLASNFAAVLTFGLSGKVYWGTALAMGVANTVGSWTGAGFAIRGGARVIKPVFGLVLGLLLLRITVLR
jgi:uncharacterized membrane protein YfcA